MPNRILNLIDGAGGPPAPLQLVDTGTTINGQVVYALGTSGSAGGGATAGGAPSGSPVVGNPVLMAGADPVNARTLLTDASGRLIMVTQTGVQSPAVQGVQAAGGALSGNPLLVAGSDGTNVRALLTDATGILRAGPTVGAAASGAAVSGNPVLVAGSDGTNARTILLDTGGRQLTRLTDGTNLQVLNTAGQLAVTTEGRRTTYSAGINNHAPPAAATDTFTLTGVGGKIVRLMRVELSGFQTTGGVVSTLGVVRSTANTGGTSGAPTAVPHDSGNAAAGGVMRAYTAVPTALGTVVGVIRAQWLLVSAINAVPGLLVWEFGTRNSQGVVLRGTGETFAINFGGVTITGGQLNCSFEWTESTD